MLSSCAQHFENVVLRRASKHVEHGFCIDIGAQDPSRVAPDGKGWRDGHVELSLIYAARLRENGDLIDPAIAGPRTLIALLEIAETGLRTGVDMKDDVRVAKPQRPEFGSLRSKIGFALVAIPRSDHGLAQYAIAIQRSANCSIVAGFFDEDRALNLPITSRRKAATSLFPD